MAHPVHGSEESVRDHPEIRGWNQRRCGCTFYLSRWLLLCSNIERYLQVLKPASIIEPAAVVSIKSVYVCEKDSWQYQPVYRVIASSFYDYLISQEQKL